MTLVPIPRAEKVQFFGATEASVRYTPPKDTIDPRARACAEHHVACDCREAEWAEERSENRAAWGDLRRAIEEILTGHVTVAFDRRGEPAWCMCTGCQIARQVHVIPLGNRRYE